MAYVKILNISCSGQYFRTAVEYATDAEKTADTVSTVSSYILEPSKTEKSGARYASCINLSSIETAHNEMMATKMQYGKMGGRLGYHIIQSFSPDDNVTPETAHEIGVRYAQELFGSEGFEVVIGTHVDKHHIHNHMIVNSVSFVDGHKAHFPKNSLHYVLRDISDRYCKEYGLSIIPYTDERHMDRAEWLARYTGKKTIKQYISEDIEIAIRHSRNLSEFYMNMENRGYEVDISGKYAKVKPVQSTRFFRLKTLGYPEDILLDRINSRERRSVVYKKRKYYGRRLNSSHRKMTQFRYFYLRWLKLLNVQKHYPKKTKLPQGEYRRFAAYKQQMLFTLKHDLATLSEVIGYRDKKTTELSMLTQKRYALDRRRRGMKKLFEAHKTVSKYMGIKDPAPDIKKKYDEALLVIAESKYTFEQVTKLRNDMIAEAVINRDARYALKKEISMCYAIEDTHRHIRKEVLRETSREKVPEKGREHNGRNGIEHGDARR